MRPAHVRILTLQNEELSEKVDKKIQSFVKGPVRIARVQKLLCIPY